MSTITLQNFRVGSDLTVKVRLKDGGVAIDWSTLSGIRAVLYSDAQSSIAGRCDVTVDGEDPTLLVCRYAATKMQYLGVNRIVVSAKYMGETKTYDKPAFTFVRWTADQEGEQITIEDPEVTVEISVEDISSSILQEAVDAAFTAADRANDAAEAAEHMVDIKTGPAGKSPYKGENGNWFEWDEEAGQYVDTGVRAKGETGDTPDISIGTVTTVEPGTPAGATMTGTPEAPVLNLSIPKGVVGDTPNITVGTVTTGEPGTPVVVEITGTAEAPVLNITIPQGMKGDTGVSADYPITIYNGLDSDATDAALSAAQGKVLDGKISQLQQEVDGKANRIYYALYKDSYIYKNSIYIDSLLIYKQGVNGVEVQVRQSYTVMAGYFLVVNRETGAIRSNAVQASVTEDEDILLISTGDGFLPTGKLVGDELANKWTDVELTVAESNKGITNTGQKVTASGYSISAPLFISAGNKVLVTTSGYSLAALSKVENGVYTPIITYGNDSITNKRTSYATIENSGYYVVSSLNFATNAAVATSENNSKIIKLNNYKISDTLVAGAVWSATSQIGEVYQPCDGAQKNYFLSQRFLAINGETDKINSITLSKPMPYYLLQYDKDFHFIGTALPSTNTTTLVNSCRFVKICAGNSTNRDYSKVIVTFDLSTRETPSWAFNGANDFIASPKILFRTYEVNEPFVTDNCEGEELTTNYRGIQTRIFNWGYIFLPKNYTRTGKPAPVIIHCHGTSGVVFNQQSLPYNTKYLEFLANCGYAVIGCSTFTSKYSSLHDDGDFPSPLAHSCYYNLWKYMTAEFNLDKTGAYIFGYSGGGMNTILLTQSKQIPIKAAAVLAGSVDLMCNMRILADYCNEHFFELIGLPNQDLPTGLAEDGERMHPISASVKSLILANKDKFIGRNPFAFNSDFDYWEFFDRYADINNYTGTLQNDSVLNELVSGAKAYFNTPIKIWHAIDDTNVPIQISRWWRTMIMNGGGLCYMREFPSGCGAHYAVGYTGNESLTPMTDYLTPFGETINTPVAYAEMVDWFKRY